MEILVGVCGPVRDEICLVEDFDILSKWKRKGVAVARSIVSPKIGVFPVRLLNCAVKMAKGTPIATLEPLNKEATICAGAGVIPHAKDHKKEELLWSIVEKAGRELSDGEKEKFFQLYSQIFASTSTDLGHTGQLQHTIDTGTAPPTRQGVRRIPHTKHTEVSEEISRCSLLFIRGCTIQSS